MYKDYVQTFRCPRKRKKRESTAGFSLIKGTWTIASRGAKKKNLLDHFWDKSLLGEVKKISLLNTWLIIFLVSFPDKSEYHVRQEKKKKSNQAV